ncbi:MAG: hypothetical protein D3917_11955 [Candidatus Electrothrix sp. AX5]|nr:hypothetical protein [Candidatus Electrothrix sp. AX5]
MQDSIQQPVLHIIGTVHSDILRIEDAPKFQGADAVGLGMEFGRILNAEDIAVDGCRIEVSGLDILDGTPIVDIKNKPEKSS